MIHVEEFKTILTDRQKELTDRLNSLETALDAPRDADSEERAVQTEGDEVMEDLGRAGLDELRAIEAALSRIEAGTYGICINCGEAISEERLRLIPAAVKCRHCMA